MSNSQEQSLDDDVVFLPVSTSQPDFLHSESERQAVERLLSAGPEAFYASVGSECSGCFLSPEEVRQIGGWARDYRLGRRPPPLGEDATTAAADDPASTYFPSPSDVPLPCLELGWPERRPWVRAGAGAVAVHTSPPVEGEPPIREIIRRHLQKASQLIAIVTDRLTDGTVIADLHSAASRGVPVYVILNQRSVQENFTLNRLRHPNMQVRVLGGKTFCSRSGRMVVGELKDKFLLVDLETVIHGSYSLTWSDAHLHRQLVTVLSGGPVVEAFDKEFRVLFAASLPAPDMWGSGGGLEEASFQLKDLSEHSFRKQLPAEQEVSFPPSPPPLASPLDWEAMGVVFREDQEEELLVEVTPPLDSAPFEKKTPLMDAYMHNGYKSPVDARRLSLVFDVIHENTSPLTNTAQDKPRLSHNTQRFPTSPTAAERMKMVERNIERSLSRQLSLERSAEDRTPRLADKTGGEPEKKMLIAPTPKRKERSRLEPTLAEESRPPERSSKVENMPSSRKPLILRVPQTESFSSLSDIMKRLHPGPSAAAQERGGSKLAATELSRSMMDLNVREAEPQQEDRGAPVPRLKASCFDPDPNTPAFSLMRKRSDDIKLPSAYRTPISFLPRERPRSSSYTLNTSWKSWLESKEEKQEGRGRRSLLPGNSSNADTN